MLASLASESEDTELMLGKDLTTVNCLEQTAAENKGPAGGCGAAQEMPRGPSLPLCLPSLHLEYLRVVPAFTLDSFMFSVFYSTNYNHSIYLFFQEFKIYDPPMGLPWLQNVYIELFH